MAQNLDVQEIFNNLMNLCTGEYAGQFVFRDYTYKGTVFRVFDYHLAGLQMWLQPSALMCRGIMFEMNSGTPVRVAALPMDKFFNYAEVKAWDKLNLPTQMQMPSVNDLLYVYDKRDGSLISSFVANGELRLKSKGSIESQQAQQAQAWIEHEQNREFYELIERFTVSDYTVNMEWTAPNNQIVLAYDEPELKILNIRCNMTGEYVSTDVLPSHMVADRYTDIKAITDLDQWVSEKVKETKKEGYILYFTGGRMVKVKTDWYCNLHHVKDSVNNSKQLVISVAEGVTDDLRQMFIDDPVSLKKIMRFEEHVMLMMSTAFNALYENHRWMAGRDRKDYAIHMKQHIDPLFFGVAMQMYQDGSGVMDKIREVVKRHPEHFIPAEYK